MANFIFNSARRLFSTAKIDWTTGAVTGGFTNYKIKAAMVNKTGGTIQSYTPPADLNNDTIQYVLETSRNMLSDFGYANAAASSSLIRDAGGNVITAELTGRALVAATGACDADDIIFNNVPTDAAAYGAVEGIVIYLEDQTRLDGGGVPAKIGDGWPVLLFLDTLNTGGMSVTPNGGDIVVQWSTSGIFRL